MQNTNYHEYLDHYFKEISEVPLLTVEEEIELAKKIKTGDQKALHKLVTANLRFVISVAKKYQNQGLSFEDLINEGNLGLIKAAKKFDASRGFKFISYAVWWIRQSILQAVSEHSRAVRLPMNKIGTIQKIGRVLKTLEQKHERHHSTDEIAEVLEISQREVSETIKTSSKELSLDRQFGSDNQSNLMDILPNLDGPHPDKNLIKESLNMEIQKVLSTLSEKESKVIRLYFGLGEKHSMTLEDIGQRFNLSRERIRQIKMQAIDKMRQTSQKEMLREYL